MVTVGFGITNNSSYSVDQEDFDYLDTSDGYMVGDNFYVSGYAYEYPDGSGFTSEYIDNELIRVMRLIDNEYSNFIYVSNYGWINPVNIDSIPGVPTGFSRTEEVESLYGLRLYYKMSENSVSVSVASSRIQSFIIYNPYKAAQTLRDLYIAKGYSNWDLSIYSVYDLGLELAAHALFTKYLDNDDVISNLFEGVGDIVISGLTQSMDSLYNHSSIADCGLSGDIDADIQISAMKMFYEVYFNNDYWRVH